MSKLPPAPLPPARSLPPAPGAPATTAPPTNGVFTIRRQKAAQCGQRVCVYGTGGIGKTEWGSLGPLPIIIDVEGGARAMTRVDVIDQDAVPNFLSLMAVLRSDILNPYQTIVIDSITRVEELLRRHILETTPTEKGERATSLESYGFGKGYKFLGEHWNLMLQAFDRIATSGKHVVLIAHDCTSNVPNPRGEDYLRYEPRLYMDKGNNLRSMTKDWVDHLLYLSYDIAVRRDGVAQGGTSRTIYTVEDATFLAKSRELPNGQKLPSAIPYPKHDTTIWNIISQS